MKDAIHCKIATADLMAARRDFNEILPSNYGK